MKDSPRILVVGCGGIGGILSGYLLRAGFAVDIVARDNPIIKSIGKNGIKVTGFGDRFTVAPDKLTLVAEPKPGSYDYVFLATQPNRVEAAIEDHKDAAKKDGNFVVLQNGLCEARLAEIVPADRIIGAVVAWGAKQPEPGTFERSSLGGFSVGRWLNQAGEIDRQVLEVAGILETIGPVKVTGNLSGARWSKLAINATISPLGTIYGRELGALLRHRFARRLALENMTETVLIAKEENINLEKVAGTLNLDWMALKASEVRFPLHPRLWLKHFVLILVGLKFRRMRSSMLRDLESGKLPPVEFLNGELMRRGQKYGVPTPVNDGLHDMVVSIHKQERTLGLHSLREVYKATR